MIKVKEAHFLNQVDIAIDNALNTPEIMEQLEIYGYDVKKLKKSQEMRRAIDGLVIQQEDAHLAAKDATRILNEVRQQADTMFGSHLAIARIAFKDDHTFWNALKLGQARERNLADWLVQIHRFYNRVVVVANVMEKYNVPQKELIETRKLIGQIGNLQRLQKKARGQAQIATQAKNKALNEMHIWMRRFLRIAKIALDENPQQLEMLGIVVAS
uniref:Uncharacterized protein n=1 Tax=Roseihalotalea indica TaxID=2867963 RepID=A0AA49JJ46_9BACT|nr:hypothetical protein K4G66_06820 [Tunicatimonas sp. TK19036]